MYQNLSEEKKTKSKNMFVNDTKIFLKWKKPKNISINVNSIKILMKIKNKDQLDTEKLII